jgi:hypothetical protein
MRSPNFEPALGPKGRSFVLIAVTIVLLSSISFVVWQGSAYLYALYPLCGAVYFAMRCALGAAGVPTAAQLRAMTAQDDRAPTTPQQIIAKLGPGRVGRGAVRGSRHA